MITTHQPTIFDRHHLRCVVSSREDGNTKPEWGPMADCMVNSDRIISTIGATLDKTVVIDVTDHRQWDSIHDVGMHEAGAGVRAPETRIVADALVTATPDLALLLPTADCYPVILYDPDNHVVALVHLGWQSTVADLLYKVVRHLSGIYASKPEVLRVYFGPAIKAESYIFAESISQETDIAWQPFLRRTEKGVGIDLLGFNLQRLKEAGLKEQHVEVCSVDTALDTRYFSHYRASRSEGGEAEGRFATVCMMV